MKDESQLRSWVRKGSTAAALWSEPAIGSTFGAPDYMDWHYGKTIALELKHCKKRTGGILQYNVRPAQRRYLPSLQSAGPTVGILISTTLGEIFLARVTARALSGKLPMDAIEIAEIYNEEEAFVLRRIWDDLNA